MNIKPKLIQLENGMTLILIPNDRVKTVSINLSFKVGSKNEKAGNHGMAHLLEHLMFEGTKKIPKGEFDRLCTMAGGVNNAYTSYDLTSYVMVLPTHQFELGLWLESDRIKSFNPTLRAIKTQKKVVSEEIFQTVYDQPYGLWRELLMETAYSNDCNYSWEVYGKIEDVKASTKDDIMNFYHKFYTPSNSCLAISGNIDVNKTISLCRKYFENIADNYNADKFSISNDQLLSGISKSFYDNIPHPGVLLAYHCPGINNDSSLSGDVICNISSSGRSSRLYNTLVYENQLASSVGAYVDKREKTSLIIFYAIANDSKCNPDLLFDELYKIISSFSSDSILENEYTRTINQLTTQLAYDFQYTSGVTDLAATNYLLKNKVQTIEEILNKYKMINLEKIRIFAENYLQKDKFVRIDALIK